MTTVYPEPQPAVIQQPMAAMAPPPVQWAPAQGARADCPAGLEQLCDLQVISILEEIDQAEYMSGAHMRNRYSVRNPLDQQIYFVTEQPSENTTATSPIDLQVQDASGRVCMTMHRAEGTNNCCSGSEITSRMQVTSGDGRKLGEALRREKCCEWKFEVRDDSDNFMFNACYKFENGIYSFVVDNGTKTPLASIIRVPGDSTHSGYNLQNLKVTFPPDAHPTVKALLLGLTILIDYSFYGSSYTKYKNYNTQQTRRSNTFHSNHSSFGHHGHSSFGHHGHSSFGHHGHSSFGHHGRSSFGRHGRR